MSQEKRTDGFLLPKGAPVIPIKQIHEITSGGRVRVEALLNKELGKKYLNKDVCVCGWSKTCRKQGRGMMFIALSDGSSVKNLQVVVNLEILSKETVTHLSKAGVAWSFKIIGCLVESPKEGQAYELQVSDGERHAVFVYGTTDQAKYPLSKKGHSIDFIRQHQHLRPRSYLFGIVTRIRSSLCMAVHDFFQNRGFYYIHTPVVTGADCEGAGETFQVTTLLPDSCLVKDIPEKDGRIDYKRDFFGKLANLTVSGQLNVENFACSMGDVYTFGPTFRAENSHTSRHLAEFWMIEPEMAFADLEDNMNCAESFIRFAVQWVLDRHPSDLEWLEANVETGLTGRLKNIAEYEFARCSYTDAIKLLATHHEEKFGSEKIEWGMDLGTAHERWLSEEHFKKPVIVFNYPYTIKAFYMKVNSEDKTVRAMDILVPKIGELVGGSQREENLEALDLQIKDKGLKVEDYWWYRELRMFGTVPHSGFGVGFERLVMLVTGVENIRDTIPFPRYPGNCEF